MGAPVDALTIYNMALLQLKQQPITTFDDTDSTAAVVGSMIYDQVRQEVLQSVSWNCARAYGTLVLVAGTTPLFDYGGVYQLPTDLVSLRQVGTQVDQWDLENKYSYDLTQRFLYYGSAGSPVPTPPSTLQILYTSDLSDITKMDALFKKVLMRALAREAAMPITGDIKIVGLCEARYEEALKEAIASNRQQRPLRVVDRNPISEAGWHDTDAPWDGQLLVPPSAWPT